MRGTIGKSLTSSSNRLLKSVADHTPFVQSSLYSTSSGRGRGGDSREYRFSFIDHTDDSEHPAPSQDPPLAGYGRGRGRPLPSEPSRPGFSAFSFVQPSGAGSGRGRGSPLGQPMNEPQRPTEPKQPIFIRKEEVGESSRRVEPNLPSSISSGVSGLGRGKPTRPPEPVQEIKEENRHLRRRLQPAPAGVDSGGERPKLSKEEAAAKALGILLQGGRGGGGGGDRGRGERMEMVGGRGRGRGGDRGRDRRRGEGRRDRGRGIELEDKMGEGLYLGNNADGEKLAKHLGPEKMNELEEAVEEMTYRVLPSPLDDDYVDAFHTNCSIEFEPEYHMEEFGTNPDIDEEPPMSLRDALEKAKPFLMVYEGIENQEKWEEAVGEVMEKVPVLKSIVEHYSGPDRVTAKKQNEELERVAKSIPESAPPSVTRFANRAVLSLQSNPGWGFDKKCQFMDKLVWEVSQQYK